MSFLHSDADKKASKKFEHYGSYRKCQAQALSYGMFSLVSGGASIYLGQAAAKKFVKFSSPGAALVAPILGGTVISWIVTSRKTKACQNMWLALEEKHTALNPVEKLDEDSSKDQESHKKE